MDTSAPKKRSASTRAPANTIRIYLRQSRDLDAQRESIPVQRGECERLAVVLGISPEAWAHRVEYVDVARSGDDNTREELARLLDDAQPSDTVLAWKQDRVGRDMIDSAATIRELVKYRRCRLYTVETGTVPVSLDSAEQTAMVMFRGMVAQGELERIRSRTRDGLRQRARDGFASGRIPFGYRLRLVDPTVADRKRSKKTIEIDEADASTVRRIFAWYLDGKGSSAIARLLYIEGTLSARGRRWAASSVWEMLRDPSYAGQWSYGEHRIARRDGRKKLEAASDAEVIRSHRPDLAIVDADTWERTQAALAARTTNMQQSLSASKHPLSGVTRCACGGALRVQTDGRPGRRVQVYLCGRRRTKDKALCSERFRVPKALLEDGVRIGLVEWFDEAHAFIKEEVREVEARLAAEGAPDVAAIERELAALRAQKQRLVKLGMLTDDLDAVAAELRTLAEQIRRLEVAHARATKPQVDTRRLAAEIEAGAVQRLDDLRTALRGPDARDALHAMFPGGLRLFLTSDAYVIEAEAVLTDFRNPSGSRTSHRTSIPFKVAIPKRKAG